MLVLGVMLVLFVVAAPEGIIGLFRKSRNARRAKHDVRARCRTARCCGSTALTKRFGGFTALDNVSVDISAGRALRPDRPERLRQDHADQLHFRRVPHRARHRDVPWRGHHATAAARAHAPRHCAQLPDSAAVSKHDGVENLMVAARFRQRHRIFASRPHEHRDTAMSILTRMGLAAKADARATEPEPGGIAQDGTRARDGDASETPDLRRGDGRAFQLGSRRGARSPDQACRSESSPSS